MTNPRVPIAVALAVLLVSAGCLGTSGGTPADDAETTIDGPITKTTTTDLDCPDDYDPYRETAVEHVADQTDSDPENVSVVAETVVDYPILGECYYHAKIRNVDSDQVFGAFVAENGSVVDRDAVEARADAAYERKYGNLSDDLSDRMQSADAGERISVEVSVADINRTAAKQAVDENRSGAEYREALSEEYERRAENKTQAVVAEIREIDGVAVESVRSLRVQIRATPEAIETVQRLDRVTWVDLQRETTTHLPGTTTHLSETTETSER